MIRLSGRSGPLLALTVAALLSGACSSGDDAGSSATTTTARSSEATRAAAAPEAGDCLEPMTQRMASDVRLPAVVACDEPHGGEVVAMFEIPDPGDGVYPGWSGRIEGADEQVRACAGGRGERGALASFLGSTPLTLDDPAVAAGATDAYAVSGLQYAVFLPGTAAWQAGARWMACAAVLSNSLKVPSSYTGSAKGALATPGKLDVTFSWCKQQPPGSRDSFVVVPCSTTHNYEQLAAFSVGADGTDYPGEDALGALSANACPPLSSQATAGASDSLPADLGLGWTYPTESEWASGDRSVRCFAVDEQGDTTGSVSSGSGGATPN